MQKPKHGSAKLVRYKPQIVKCTYIIHVIIDSSVVRVGKVHLTDTFGYRMSLYLTKAHVFEESIKLGSAVMIAGCSHRPCHREKELSLKQEGIEVFNTLFIDEFQQSDIISWIVNVRPAVNISVYIKVSNEGSCNIRFESE